MHSRHGEDPVVQPLDGFRLQPLQSYEPHHGLQVVLHAVVDLAHQDLVRSQRFGKLGRMAGIRARERKDFQSRSNSRGRYERRNEERDRASFQNGFRIRPISAEAIATKGVRSTMR